MKRLFILRRGKKGTAVLNDDDQPLYFANKMTAKAERDRLGDGIVVSYGPDHSKFTTLKHGDK
jgi:hypothetical protein